LCQAAKFNFLPVSHHAGYKAPFLKTWRLLFTLANLAVKEFPDGFLIETILFDNPILAHPTRRLELFCQPRGL
jgi:hypothetical protein